MLHLIKGKEEFLRRQALRDIVLRAKKADSDISVNYSLAKDYRKGKLAEWMSPTLFGAPPITVIEEAENLTDALIEDVCELAENCVKSGEIDAEIVILHSGAVRGKKMITAISKMPPKAAETITADELKKDSEKVAFVQVQFKRNGKMVANDAAMALVSYVGEDVAVLAGYVQQLADDAGETMSISKEYVDTFFKGLLEVDVWDIISAAIAGDSFKALTLFRHSTQHGESPASIIPRMAMKLRQLTKASAVISGKMSAKEIGMQDWQIRNMQKDLNKFNTGKLAKSFEALAEADACSKGGSEDKGYLAFETAVRIIAGDA